MKTKRINLRNHVEVMALLKVLYGDEDVTDDNFNRSAEGAHRASCSSGMAKMPPEAEKVLSEKR